MSTNNREFSLFIFVDNMPETPNHILSFTGWSFKISGTDDYITEIIFNDKVQRLDVRKKNLSPMMIQCLEQLIQYFNGQRRKFELPSTRKALLSSKGYGQN
jgi:hypothetical protein